MRVFWTVVGVINLLGVFTLRDPKMMIFCLVVGIACLDKSRA